MNWGFTQQIDSLISVINAPRRTQGVGIVAEISFEYELSTLFESTEVTT